MSDGDTQADRLRSIEVMQGGIAKRLDALHEQGNQIQTALQREKKRSIRLQNLVIAVLVLLVAYILFRDGRRIADQFARALGFLRGAARGSPGAGRGGIKERLSRLLKSLGISLFVTAVVVGALEGGIRLFGHAPKDVWFWETNVRNYDGRLDGGRVFNVRVRTNGQGLREPENIGPKPPGVVRIAVVGDSMTFGWGVEGNETIPYYLEEILRARFRKNNVEVINFGVPGTKISQYFNVVRKYARKVDASLVVVNVLLSNDTHLEVPVRYLSDTEIRSIRDQMIASAEKADIDPERAWRDRPLLWNLAVVRVLVRAWHRREGIDERVYGVYWQGPESMTAASRRDAAGSVPSADARLAACRQYLLTSNLCTAEFRSSLRSERSRQAYDWYAAEGLLGKACACDGGDPVDVEYKIKYVDNIQDLMMLRPESRRAMLSQFRAAVGQIQDIKSVAAARGAQVVVGFIPEGWLVDKRSLDHFARDFVFVPEMLETTAEDEFLLAECARLGIRAFSTLAEFRRHADDEESLFLNGDYHTSARGNRLYAARLAKEIAPLIPD